MNTFFLLSFISWIWICSAAELELLNWCQRNVQVDSEVTLRLQDHSTQQITCTLKLQAPSTARLHLHWGNFTVAADWKHKNDISVGDFIQRHHDGVAVRDSDGNSLFAPLERYYASINKLEVFQKETICLKYGITSAPCKVYVDWVPKDYGILRDIVSTGNILNLEYIGVPEKDYFDLYVTAVRDSSECENVSCGNVGLCSWDNKSCLCPPSHTGQDCTEAVDECTEYKACKAQHHFCVDTPESFQCDCRPGYESTADNFTCKDVNECSSEICHEKATCTNTEGSYFCTCPEGLAGDGISCYKDCSTNPCQNGGTCEMMEKNQYYCTCPPGYSGPDCNEERKPCESSPCLNGGTCFNQPDRFSCECKAEYTGRTCKFKIVQDDSGSPYHYKRYYLLAAIYFMLNIVF